MNKLIFGTILIAFNCVLAQAQQSENKESGFQSVFASAKGDDSYLLFSDHWLPTPRRFINSLFVIVTAPVPPIAHDFRRRSAVQR
jgi:hypothetical protein